MNERDLLKKIREIVFSVPDELYKFSMPDNCFDEEWNESTPREKAFLLIEDLLFKLNRSDSQNKKAEHINVKILKLGACPRFFSTADENMFFNSLYSIPSYVQIKGDGRELTLYHKIDITKEEKQFLISLFKRYQMSIPLELNI